MKREDLILETSYEPLVFQGRLITAESWENLRHNLMIYFHNQLSWIYRGQEDVSHDLKTSIERTIEHSTTRDIQYANLFYEFQRGAANYLSRLPAKNDLLEWEALMRHYGSPTRLLDWTYSPHVACYFACINFSKDQKTNDAAIWILNETALLQLCRELFNQKIEKDLFKGHARTWNQPRIYRKISQYALSAKNQGFILPITPIYKNERLLAQQGTFTVSGKSGQSFADNLWHLVNLHKERKFPTSLNDLVTKYVIPNKFIEQILTELFSMNITSRTLFPGFEGYAQSLHQYAAQIKYQIYNLAEPLAYDNSPDRNVQG